MGTSSAQQRLYRVISFVNSYYYCNTIDTIVVSIAGITDKTTHPPSETLIFTLTLNIF